MKMTLKLNILCAITMVMPLYCLATTIHTEEFQEWNGNADKESLFDNILFTTPSLELGLTTNMLGDDYCLIKPMGWKPGAIVVGEKYDVCFARCYYYEENRNIAMEDITCLLVVATCSKDKQLIDAKVVGADGITDSTQIKAEIKNKRIVAKYAKFRDYANYTKYWPLKYVAMTTHYDIDSNGKILCTQKGSPQNMIVAAQYAPAKRIKFNDFVSHFSYSDDSVFSKDCFKQNNEKNEIGYYESWKFIDSSDIGQDGTYWIAGKYTKYAKTYIMFATKVCDTPRNEEPYAMPYILTYNTKGQLIDSCSVGKENDTLFLEYLPPTSNHTLNVVQKNKTIATDNIIPNTNHQHVLIHCYTINQDGTIAIQ
ncbi:MAG: hypothetical protein MJY95_01385 [Bacteroidaceae bacterium]|nr:hypothetical protein [Bacteroidaceae bacterium]